MPEPRFAGFDIGGTKTVCLVGDGERVLGRGVAGGGNPSNVGFDGLARYAHEALAAALDDAGPATSDARDSGILAAWLGIAGIDSSAAMKRARVATAAALGIKNVGVSNDAALILPAAGKTAGVALVAGTGSFAMGVGPADSAAIAGGWGYLFGDEGSGYELGRLALRAISRAEDGRGRATVLTAMLLGELNLESPRQLTNLLYPTPSAPTIARHARLVLAAAAAGDPVARALIDDAVEELVAQVRASSRRAGLVGPQGTTTGPGPVAVVVAGGLASPGSPVVPAIAASLGAAYHVEALIVEPAVGALVLARHERSFG